MEQSFRRRLLLPAAVALPAGVFFVAAFAFFVLTKTTTMSWNERTRLATIESLVERGTFKIDGSSLNKLTKDKVRIGGHYYGDKPPLLQIIASAPYAVLHAWGLRLKPSACPGPACAYRPLTFVLVGLPSAAMLAFFAGFARAQMGSAAWALAMTALLGACTLVWPYSLVFNNHVPAAAALLAAFVVVPPQLQVASPRRLLCAGALAGLAIGFELLAALPVLALAALVAWRFRRGVLWFGAGILAVSAVSVLADLATWGHWLPPYFATRGYRYPGSPYSASVGGLIPPKGSLLNILCGSLGEQGLVAHSPAILWAIGALVQVLRARSHPFRCHAIAAAAGILAFAACLFLGSSAHGGQSYGNRHFLAILLFFFAPLAPRAPRSRLALGAVAVAGLIGFVSASRGARQPWKAVPPPLYIDVVGPNHQIQVCNGLVETCWPSTDP